MNSTMLRQNQGTTLTRCLTGLAAGAATVALTLGSGLALASPATATPAANPTPSAAVTFDSATRNDLRQLESTALGRYELLRAFQTGFAPTIKIEGPRLTSQTPSVDVRDLRPELTCLPGLSCGLSSSGGWHFWVIASYASILGSSLVAMVPDCTAALSAVITPVVALAACGGVAYALWVMSANEPRYTNHGVWLAVYWWGLQDGRLPHSSELQATMGQAVTAGTGAQVLAGGLLQPGA
jgi:hypothetical protein